MANAAIAANDAPVRQGTHARAQIRAQAGPGHRATTPAQQAAFVAQRVLELREEGVDLNNMAVLYRSHFHALELQLELTRRNIPFSITSGIRFFEQAHIKDVAAYLKLVSTRAMNFPSNGSCRLLARHRRQRRGQTLELASAAG